MKTIATLLSLALLASPALAQANAEAKKPFVLPPGEIELNDLVDVCANYLNRNILFDKQEVGNNSSTTLQRPITVDRDGCEELMSSLLYRKGFAVIPIDPKRDLWEVISLTGPRGQEIYNAATYKKPEEILLRPQLKVMVVTIVELKHTNAQLAQNALRPFFANGSHRRDGINIGTVGNVQSLLIQGFQDRVAQAIKMVQLSDVPQEDELRMVSGRRTKDHIKNLNERIKKLEEMVEALLINRK